MKKRVLVTGGEGFIGSHLVCDLVSRGYSVASIDGQKDYSLISKSLTKRITTSRLKLLKGSLRYHFDLNDKARLKQVISNFKPQSIIHAGDLSVASYCESHPEYAKKNILDSTKTLLNSIDNIHCEKLIYLSSSMVYGNFKSRRIDENHEQKPTNLYGKLKLENELSIKRWGKEKKVDTIICRPMAVYGPYDINARVIFCIFQKASTNETFHLNGNEAKLSFTYIGDVTQGVYLCLEKEEANNEIFNLSSGDLISLLDLVEIVKSEFYPCLDYKILEEEKLRPKRGGLRIEKIKKLLNFEPNTNLLDGLRNYYNWFSSLKSE